MSRIAAKSCAVYVDQYDMTGISNAVDADISSNPAGVTAFADTDETYVEGKGSFTVNIQGLYSTSSPDWDSYIFSNLTTTSRFLGVYPGGRTAGNRGYEYVTIVSASPRTAETNRAIMVNANWQGENAAVARAQILGIVTAQGASANGSALQTGAAAATQTIVGVMRLLASPAGAGNNTMDLKIQSAPLSDFAAPTDRLTFAQLNQASAAQVEVVVLAGAVTDTWWRVVYTYAGAGSRTFSLVTTFGIRVT